MIPEELLLKRYCSQVVFVNHTVVCVIFYYISYFSALSTADKYTYSSFILALYTQENCEKVRQTIYTWHLS